MSEPIKLNSGAVTTLADTDRVVGCDSTGALRSISLADLLRQIRDNIKVGGRNLIPNSNFEKGIGGISVMRGSASLMASTHEGNPIRIGGKALYMSSNNADTYFNPISLGKLEPGTYTLTIWGRNAGSISHHSSYVYVDGAAIIPIDTVFSTHNSPQKKSITFEIPGSSASWPEIALRIGIATTGLAWLLIEAMKLERGNIPTDWTPAPEDLSGGGNSQSFNWLRIKERRCAA